MKESLLKTISLSESVTSLLAKSGNFVVNDTIGISLIFAAIFDKKPGKYLVVCPNLYSAQKVADMIASLISEENVLLFPMDDLMRCELLTSSKEILAQRLYVIDQCLNDENKIIVTHATSLLTPLPNPAVYVSKVLKIEVGKSYNLNELKMQLVNIGYSQVGKINQSLQFACRGDILDIFSINYNKPIRIEFFGDEVESIHYFEISNQTSNDALNAVRIIPATECIFTEQELNNFKINLNKQLDKDCLMLGNELGDLLKQNTSLDYEKIISHSYSPRVYKYIRYIRNDQFSIIDYFKPDIVCISNEKQYNSTVELLNTESRKYFSDLSSQGRLLSHLEMFLNNDVVFKYNKPILCNLFKEHQNEIDFDVRPLVINRSNTPDLNVLVHSFLDTKNKVIFALSNKQQLDSISNILNDKKIEYEFTNGLEIPNKKVGLSIFPLEEGFELKQQSITYISSRELFGFLNKSSRFASHFKQGVILKNYDELQPGDYVVHEYYGIGRFLEIKTMEIDGVHRDYLNIQYAGTSSVYIPLTQFKLVRKYAGREGFEPKLSNLNSHDWDKTKKRIKERVNELADRLFQLYTERAKIAGYSFDKDDEFQKSFESEFPYELTKDQAKAVEDIKKDMESSSAMDRLLCGDVGFGKTEVAFRAIFKAIESGKQAAILCPTTLLARQHYELACERFRNYGVNIAVISRLVPEKKQKEYIEKIKNGEIHLVIGTHRLLSKDFSFKDLGLLVVDEEQRFGVEQKESIKELKSNIDVLSLSATPIPRTLQLSLIGVRPVSQIITPPNNRNTIQTYVAPFSSEVARELMERELSRKGQVFYIHNVVSTISQKAQSIQRQIPSARIGVIHGKMDRDDIENVMNSFYQGDIDILVATSIIENGIDIPNANLIIIEDADRFGLAQLYQIKGRVGRGDRVAYAYLFYRDAKIINRTAQKRLKTIQDFAELGSGFKIAQRDLMIRGAGDILGPEQAGFIDSIGLDLYLKMLNEVIEEKKTGIPHETPKPVKMLQLDAYIPGEYASNEDKIQLYQEIENAKNVNDLKDIKKKVRDIYGKIPNEVQLLFKKRRIDILLSGEEFDDVSEYESAIEIKLSKKFSEINGIGNCLFESLQSYLDKIQVTYMQKVLRLRLKKEGNWILDFETIVEVISTIYKKLSKNDNINI